MKYSGIIYNDFSAAPGVSLSFFTQGCPYKCKGCHNPETWSFDGGKEFTTQTLASIISGLTANGIQRNLSILGGEPLCEENAFLTELIIREIRKEYPSIKIFVWTGGIYETLQKSTNPHIQYILHNITTLIDGPYIEAERDITLPLRGSRNQRIISLNN